MATKKKGTKRKATRAVAKKPAHAVVRRTVKVPAGTKRFRIRVHIGKAKAQPKMMMKTMALRGESPIEPDPTDLYVPAGTKEVDITVEIGNSGKKAKTMMLTTGESPIEPDPTDGG